MQQCGLCSAGTRHTRHHRSTDRKTSRQGAAETGSGPMSTKGWETPAGHTAAPSDPGGWGGTASSRPALATQQGPVSKQKGLGCGSAYRAPGHLRTKDKDKDKTRGWGDCHGWASLQGGRRLDCAGDGCQLGNVLRATCAQSRALLLSGGAQCDREVAGHIQGAASRRPQNTQAAVWLASHGRPLSATPWPPGLAFLSRVAL